MSPRVVPNPPIRRVLRPIREFGRVQASGGIVLLACSVVAILWANAPFGHTYEEFWHTKLSIGVGSAGISWDLRHWINDGLMVIFFLVVGLEIKREFLVGELADRRRVALPLLAALGGMVVPAAIYWLINRGTPGEIGWGIPMSIDIAFALGVLALLGNRVPLALRVLVTAVAIIDDIGAILVIAVFYTARIDLSAAAVGIALLLLLAAANRAGVRSPLVYGAVGILVWLAFVRSGIHATIAGVLLAFTIPAWVRLDTGSFLARARTSLERVEDAARQGGSVLTDQVQQHALQDLETSCERAQAPLQRLEHTLHPWVSFAIVPVFALANAGTNLGTLTAEMLLHPVTLGVVLGLILGNQIGIMAFTWATVRLRIAVLPPGITWAHLYGATWVAGIGFTMSLFIANLAFGEEALLQAAKMGILIASPFCGVVGYLLLGRIGRRRPATGVAAPA
ncbi:MAG: Na+/H+ antiporter NhaA [Chloroflexi bacterium]|nr:Na+/H+ antiporter NhaA [Chloroflexota bacterium]